MQWRPSLTVIYFLAGFTLMAVLTMLTLVVFRPLLGEQPSTIVRGLAMYAPLITGIPFGLRLIWLGRMRGYGLGKAIKTGLMFWVTAQDESSS